MRLGVWHHRRTGREVQLVSTENEICIVQMPGGFLVLDPARFRQLFYSPSLFIEYRPIAHETIRHRPPRCVLCEAGVPVRPLL